MEDQHAVRRRGALLIAAAMAGLLLSLAVDHDAALAQDQAEDEAIVELAELYAPVIAVKAQDEQCDASGEQYLPAAADIVLDNPEVLLRQVGANDPVVKIGPSATDLFELGEGFYLDWPGLSLEPGCIYERDYRRYNDGGPVVVYAHVATQAEYPDKLALQYWFFYYFNDWNNKHEGDWEGIQLIFDVGTVEEALLTEPVEAGYSQHFGGERAGWNDDKLERRATHPVVYPAVGSHPSHYESELYLGRSGSEGFGCDSTVGPSIDYEPTVIVLPDEVLDADDRLAWLEFGGRWGERGRGAFNAPTGPKQIKRWTAPIDWQQDDLRNESVIVPGGRSDADALISTFCDVVAAGSAQLVTLQQDPGLFFVVVVIIIVAVAFLLRRTDWSPVQPLPIVRRRQAGQLIKAALILFRQRALRFLAIGLIYLPIAMLVGLAVSVLRWIPFIDAVLESEPNVGFVGVVLAIMIGGLGHFLGLTVVTAAVAIYMRRLEQGEPSSVGDDVQETLRRLRGLLAAFFRGLVIVGLLVLSVVGVPWGIRQLVRYQFIGSVTVLDGKDGNNALDGSSTLVKGRWFQTAAVIVLLNVLVGLVSAIAGLVLLVLLTGLPLWLFSILVTMSSALVVPYTAIAMVLLYGDAKAEVEGAERADGLELVEV
ncbi:MAG: hypothetical protein ACR2QO_27045 [Acidimicrobiales bacterium]